MYVYTGMYPRTCTYCTYNNNVDILVYYCTCTYLHYTKQCTYTRIVCCTSMQHYSASAMYVHVRSCLKIHARVVLRLVHNSYGAGRCIVEFLWKYPAENDIPEKHKLFFGFHAWIFIHVPCMVCTIHDSCMKTFFMHVCMA